jgi:tRNA/tmRNA/rRNA uracil-C5-methylase (TrmA/RlmC/RlmD family)
METIQTIEIIDYSSEGLGVAKLKNGCVVFVENAVRGDVCEIVITKSLKRVSYGRIERIISPSQHRISNDCPYIQAGVLRCGGCDFRHISYEEELWAKRKRVNDALRRIGGVNIEVEDILTTGKIHGYRNNVQLKSDGKKVGFYAKNSHDIVEIDKCLLVNDEMNEAIRRRETRIRTSTEKIGDLTFRISPKSFFQVNTEAAFLLYEKAREYADLKPHESLLDLYCGAGTITLFLARDAKKAAGVEINSAAVDNARENAELNNIHNVDFICDDAENFTPADFAPDCVVVDPPRKGCSPVLLQKIMELNPARIVYASCDTATLARDIKLLTGYEVKRACAVDMFPRTRHVECVVLLCNKITIR